jgi:beta-glucosidase
VTVPHAVGQLPLHYHHKRSARRSYVSMGAAALYPFGHGLSYTQFAYRDLRVEPARIDPGRAVRVVVTVTNTGDRPGDEVVQLYLRDEVSSVTTPERLLRGFQRVRIEPGQSREISFMLGPEELAVLNPRFKKVVEPGTFTVMIGGSSATALDTQFEVTALSPGSG